MKTVNSFIPWIGGKKLLRSKIIEMFPKDPVSRYIEVFGGAGWVLFGADKHAELEIFNDLDGNLINLYRCIKYHLEELKKEISTSEFEWSPNSRELFFDYREQINQRGLTDIQRSAKYFLLIRLSFSADVRSFSCNNKASILQMLNKFPKISDRIRNVVIENRDFEPLIKAYDRPDALFYLDPPYYSAEKYYDGFGKSDHERLRKALENLKGRFILSYNDSDAIKSLYRNFNVSEISRGNNLSKGNGRKYQELIVTNY